MIDAGVDERTQPVRDLLGRTARQLALHVQLGRFADVEPEAEAADVYRVIADRLGAVGADELHRVWHLRQGRALGQPTVAALGGAPESRVRRPTDPDRRTGLLDGTR